MHRHTSSPLYCHAASLTSQKYVCEWRRHSRIRGTVTYQYIIETDPFVSPQNLTVTPKEASFLVGDAIFLPFYGAIFIPSIIHSSLIREDDIGTLVFTLQFGCTQVCLCNKLE